MDISYVLVPNKYKVTLLDRYDIYFGIGKELIEKCSESTVILIDYKGNDSISSKKDWCTIERTQDTIEVVQ